ncbi:PilZ domain-containing protein [Candidatus Omnitrophota bacterium]
METRLAPRKQIDLKVLARIPEDSEQKFSLAEKDDFEVTATDISITGLGLLSKYFLPKGLILLLEINGAPLGIEKTMELRGEVRYSRSAGTLKYRCGFKFLNPPADYVKKIETFIAGRERRKSPRVKLAE